MIRIALIVCFGILASSTLSAQATRTQHQTFSPQEAPHIRIQLVDEYTVEFWSSNNIMAETSVELYDGSPAILKFFAEQKLRYNLEMEPSAKGLLLRSHDAKREGIQHKGQTCFETVRVRLFVPDIYEWTEEHTLELKNRHQKPATPEDEEQG